MEQIKSNNIKTEVIMENLISKVKNIFSKPTETIVEEPVKEEVKKEGAINLEQDFTLDAINTKEFVQWLKQDIKDLVADQKVAKRDRKDTKHPCPDKRVYKTWEAQYAAQENSRKLRYRYFLYYLLRKEKDFRWDTYQVKVYHYWAGTGMRIDYDYTKAEYMFDRSSKVDKILSDHRNWSEVQHNILDVINDYVEFTKKED